MPTPGTEQYQVPTSSRCPVLSLCKDFICEPHQSRHTASQHNQVNIYVIQFTIMTLYLLSSGSRSILQKSISLVKYLILACSLWLMSSKWIIYPTYLTKGFSMKCIIIQHKANMSHLLHHQALSPLLQWHVVLQMLLQHILVVCMLQHFCWQPSLPQIGIVEALRIRKAKYDQECHSME